MIKSKRQFPDLPHFASLIEWKLPSVFRTRTKLARALTISDLAKIAKRFKQTAITLGYDVSDAKYVYQFPKDHGIDALKDNQANILAMQSGGTTLDRILEENYISKEEWEKDIEYRRSLQLDGLVDVGKGGGTKNNSQAKSNSAE